MYYDTKMKNILSWIRIYHGLTLSQVIGMTATGRRNLEDAAKLKRLMSDFSNWMNQYTL